MNLNKRRILATKMQKIALTTDNVQHRRLINMYCNLLKKQIGNCCGKVPKAKMQKAYNASIQFLKDNGHDS